MEHTNVRYTEAWDMPVTVRKWWLHRASKENSTEPKPKNQGPAPWSKFKK